ncbi:hypothetical protein [uncultured Lentilactobacillus sp.]|nr:hypothetical protein [uncultured Lentilactobacillus sp.]
MTDKKAFSEKRWREWPSKGITTGGKPKPKVHKVLMQWLKDNTKKG